MFFTYFQEIVRTYYDRATNSLSVKIPDYLIHFIWR